MEDSRKQRSAGKKPIRCLESYRQVCEIQEAALTLSEAMQEHERGPCGRRHRAWTDCKGLRRAERPGTLRRPPRSEPGANGEGTHTAPERIGAAEARNYGAAPRIGRSSQAHRRTA